MNKPKSAGNVKQGVLYIYGSLMMALVFGLVSSSLTARLMAERELGQYRFLISCVTVLTSALTLGLFSSAGTLLASKRGGTFRTLVARGASTQGWMIAATCSVCVGVVLLADPSTKNQNFWVLAAALLGGVMAWPLLLQEVLRASSNFFGLAVLNAAPMAIFLFFLIVSQLFSFPLNTPFCATLYFLSQGLVVWALVSKYEVAMRPNKIAYAYLFKANKGLGLNVYFGSFLAALTAQSGIFLLQGIKSPAEVAVFSLAITVTAPLTMLPSAVGTAYFSRLPGTWGFPSKVIPYTWLVSFVITVVFCVLVPLIIHILYGEKFSSVTIPAQLCGVAAILNGMGDVYNRYYLANRDTKFLLKTAGVVCATALVVGFPAGDLFGPIGIAFARLLSSGAYVLILLSHYHFAKRRFGSKEK